MLRLFESFFNPLAAVGQGEQGRNCLAYQPEEDAVQQLFRRQLQQLGVTPQVDAWGNSYGTWVPPGCDAQQPAMAMGSHLDSVPNGGRYDGVLGVAAGLTVLKQLQQQGEGSRPLRVIAWRGEESARFRSSCLGSKGACGVLTPAKAQQMVDAHGETLWQALQGCRGTDPSPVQAATTHGLLEIHIEQGPILAHQRQQQGQPVVGVVHGIAGSLRQRWPLAGLALPGFAALILAIQQLAESLDQPQRPLRMTVTPCHCAPNVGRDDATLLCVDPAQAQRLAAASPYGTAQGAEVRLTGPHRFHTGGQPMSMRWGVDQVLEAAQLLVANPQEQGVRWPAFERPGGMQLQLDIRGADSARMAEVDHALAERLGHRADAREMLGETMPDRLSQTWATQIQQVAHAQQIPTLNMASGAGHDVQIPDLHNRGLLFIASEAAGVSHHPSEAICPADLEQGLQLLLASVQALSAP
ncbi:M20/M25/M40 family metallo-hydrolase [Magnetococcus sp. PR-3]|uniref:M20/M25/M40 family metallo-hydrolase n=1 Tax=Magnetococcus sp. PR-3 TaxID=3120355 RepID=UPI002FCE2A05